MNTIEAKSLFSEVVEKLWPNWSLSDDEVNFWASRLQYYDYNTAKYAFEQAYSESTSKPNLKRILNFCRSKQPPKITNSQDNEPVLLYICKRIDDGPGKELKFYSKTGKIPNEETLLANAEIKCEQLSQTYGGKWIAFLASNKSTDTDNPPIYGEEARQIAIQNILNGEDCAGKRFLQIYLDKKKKAQPQSSQEKEAQSISEILIDDIPF